LFACSCCRGRRGQEDGTKWFVVRGSRMTKLTKLLELVICLKTIIVNGIALHEKKQKRKRKN
jgi:hypothetical protein